MAPYDARLLGGSHGPAQGLAGRRFGGTRALDPLVYEHLRRRASAKRGGGMQRVEPPTGADLDCLPAARADRADDLCVLDELLQAMATREPRDADPCVLGITISATQRLRGPYKSGFLRGLAVKFRLSRSSWFDASEGR